MTSLQGAFVIGVANPSNHGRNGEHDVEFDQKNEPIVKMPELNKKGTARYNHIGYELGEENKAEGFSPRLPAAKPTADWPEYKPAPVNQDSHRGQENIEDGIVHYDGRHLTSAPGRSLAIIRLTASTS